MVSLDLKVKWYAQGRINLDPSQAHHAHTLRDLTGFSGLNLPEKAML